MTTIGTLLYYGPKIADTEFTAELFTTWKEKATQIRGVQNIPELQSAPQQIDVTSIEDYEEQSEPGLITGSSLNITMNYKEGIYANKTEMNPDITTATEGDLSNFQQCLNLYDDEVRGFMIILKNGRWFAFNAKAVTTVGAVASASVMPFTLSLYKRSGVYSGYSKDGGSKTPTNYFALRSAGIMDASKVVVEQPAEVPTEEVPEVETVSSSV